MAFYKSYPLSGNPARALEVARNYFIFNGFQLTELSAAGFRAVRPTNMPHVQQHNPLMTLGEVAVSSAGGSLTIEAKTKGNLKLPVMIMLLTLTIVGLAVGVEIAGGNAGGNPKSFPYPILAVPVIIGLVVGGIMASLRNVATRLLDVLAANAALVAEHESGGRR